MKLTATMLRKIIRETIETQISESDAQVDKEYVMALEEAEDAIQRVINVMVKRKMNYKKLGGMAVDHPFDLSQIRDAIRGYRDAEADKEHSQDNQ